MDGNRTRTGSRKKHVRHVTTKNVYVITFKVAAPTIFLIKMCAWILLKLRHSHYCFDFLSRFLCWSVISLSILIVTGTKSRKEHERHVRTKIVYVDTFKVAASTVFLIKNAYVDTFKVAAPIIFLIFSLVFFVDASFLFQFL